jgi:hypothetical protein
MNDRQKKAPKAGGAANGTSSSSVETIGTERRYNAKAQGRKRILAIGPNGQFSVAGKNARTLVELVQHAGKGITALEMSNSWALRLGAYVHVLRHECGLEIETIREAHDDYGGWHGRYVLQSPVTILGESA